jgi:hypothetical protein
LEYVLAAAYAAFFAFLVSRHRFYRLPGLSPGAVRWFFLYKVAAGVAMYCVYTFYYTDRLTADTFKYFDDSAVLFDLFFSDSDLFWQFMAGGGPHSEEYLRHANSMNTWFNQYAIYNDARTMVRFNALLRFVTFGHYHVHSVIFAFLSFTGLAAMGRVLVQRLPAFRREFLALVFLFPSLAFWSAGVMKDGLIFFTLGFCMHCLDRLLAGAPRRGLHAAGLLFFLLLLFYSKLHIFLLFVACGGAWAGATLLRRRRWLAFLAAPLLCGAAAALSLQAGFGIDPWAFAQARQAENIRAAEALRAGSMIAIGRLDGTAGGMLRQAPAGFFNALLRPHVFDRQSPVIAVATAENVLLLLLVVLALASAARPVRPPPLFGFALLYVLLLFTAIGIMTPVLGALVRYKIQGLPFLFFILLTLASKDRALQRFPFLRRLAR